MKKPYFEGWYFKQQNEKQSIALIPAYHMDKEGRVSASIQIIYNKGVYYLEYDIEECRINTKKPEVRIGNSYFSKKGIKLNISSPHCKITGDLKYNNLLPPKYNIMGPFQWIPFMQCRHSVISLGHSVSGHLNVNGVEIGFNQDYGYIESDQGTSFPSSYLWTQYGVVNPSKFSVMLAVADIPWMGLNFTGTVGFILFKGEEYRLASYLGARILKWNSSSARIQQGKLLLLVDLLEGDPKRLKAPESGGMTRTVQESISCKVRYRFYKDQILVVDILRKSASFEYSRTERTAPYGA